MQLAVHEYQFAHWHRLVRRDCAVGNEKNTTHPLLITSYQLINIFHLLNYR